MSAESEQTPERELFPVQVFGGYPFEVYLPEEQGLAVESELRQPDVSPETPVQGTELTQKTWLGFPKSGKTVLPERRQVRSPALLTQHLLLTQLVQRKPSIRFGRDRSGW
jgi:hypothetical protein